MTRKSSRVRAVLSRSTLIRARRAPFGFPSEGALGPGKGRLPSKVNAIIETAIKKIYYTDVAAVIEEVQLQCFKAKTKFRAMPIGFFLSLRRCVLRRELVRTRPSREAT
jgi:hypothetical protein